MGYVVHDAHRQGANNNVTFNASNGASVSSSAFGSQTRYIRICLQGAVSATSGVRYAIDKSPTASSTSALLPVNWVEVVRVSPGEKIAVLSNDTTTGTLSVVELTD